MPEVRCPDCGSLMILRTARRGSYAGKQFYGCSKYPSCTRTIPLDNPGIVSLVSQHKTRVGQSEAKTSVIEKKQEIASDFKGTIIDIEAIGEFDKTYKNTNDSREYQRFKQVIFGFINRGGLSILCANGEGAICELGERTLAIIETLERPFYAFNTHFESGVLFHQLGEVITFDGELQEYKGEGKANARQRLSIENYDDPFYDVGYSCMQAWLNGQFDEAIAHNRACLLKERDILLKRGPYKPDEMKFAEKYEPSP